MKNKKNAKKYARMFLNAVGLEAAPQALKELKTAHSLMDGSREFRGLLTSPMIAEAEREKALAAVGQKLAFSGPTVKFLGFLTKEGAADALGGVIEKAIALYLERKSRVKATVIAPAEVGKAYEARLIDSIKKLTGKEVEIEYEVDPALIGGMLVRVGSTMYDGSVRGQLRILRDELVRG
jgi:ATP synthase F1 delta subunit